MENPTSSLATPKPQFYSRYSDPNHPASSGSLISLITGGHINPQARRTERKAAKEERRQNRRTRRVYRRGEVFTPETGLRRKRKPGLVKRILQKVSFGTSNFPASSSWSVQANYFFRMCFTWWSWVMTGKVRNIRLVCKVLCKKEGYNDMSCNEKYTG